MNLAHLYSVIAKRMPNRLAIIDGPKRITFKEFNRRVNCLANAIHVLGLRKGDRVGLLMANCHQYLEARAALEKSGIVYVPLNTLLAEPEKLYILQDAEVSAVVCGEEYLASIMGMKSKIQSLRFIVCVTQNHPLPEGVYSYEELISSASDREPEGKVTEDDLCSINYTSGTTGRPKGVMLTQGNWMAVYRNMLVDRDIRHDDILAHIGPLTHASGSYFMPYYLRGATNLIVPGGFDVERLFDAIDREKVTAFTCVPTMLIRILAGFEAGIARRYDLSSLRNVGYGAAPMPVEKIREAITRMGPIFTQNYGLTEAYMTVCVLPKEDHVLEGPENLTRRLASVGRPYTYVEVRVVGEDGVDLPPGATGEVVVRSPHVMKGYWRQPEETAKVLKDGWLYTGDLATTDEEGYVYLVGRKKDMIISGGFNIYPREVEDVLLSHPQIEDAAVVGLPDQEWGEIVAAAIVPKNKERMPDEQELMQFCRERLSFKRPKRIIFVDSIPKSSTGKVDKKALKELFGKRG